MHFGGDDIPFEIAAAYIPNAERSPTEKRVYWDWLLQRSQGLLDRPAVICGDLNTAIPYVDQDGDTIPCADSMSSLVESGWVDLWRLHHGAARESSWWSNAGNGFRLDHAFGTPSVTERCTSAAYHTSVDAQCLVHDGRRHDGCVQTPLSDHALLVVDFA